MLKKVNLITIVIFAVLLSGCDKQKAQQQADMNPNYHNLPVDLQNDLISQVEDQAENTDPVDDDSSTIPDDSADDTTSEEEQVVSTDGASETGSANAAIFREATEALGESSEAGPGGGSVACAWMVNKVLKRSVGITVDGNATLNMNEDFRSMVAAGKAEAIPVADAKPGDVIISPTEYRNGKKNTGHVGIVGQGGTILSNGGRTQPNGGKDYKWRDKFNMASWKGYYQSKKGLDMNVYRIIS
ncbi:MAG: hypothetical protein KC646_16610 [Candidatus Cloacimonetes bacterium]|nr:hypothetical protein [Candidatus Cloacimonadota bacterium]